MRLLRSLLLFVSTSWALALHAGVTVTISPTTATVAQGASKTFKATVTGSSNTGVTWSVSSGGGSITTAGVYTAPATAGTYIVTVTSKADTTKKATATVTVPMKITISPTSASLGQGATKTFVATVTGSANKAVAWSVSSGGGSITAAGIYTAPSTSGTYTITATTQAVPAASVTATVTVTGVSISISPSSISMPVNGTKTFTATVSGTTNKAVTWSAAVGSITNAGAYTAPAGVGSDTVTATSVADPSKSAVSAITVKIGVTISPATLFMNQGDSTSFTAGVDGSDDQTVTWSATGGTMDEWGDYLAPDSAGTQTITARSVADPSVAATAKVRVEFYSIQVTFSPDQIDMSSIPYGLDTNQGVTLPPGGQISYDLQIFGAIGTNAAIKVSSRPFSSSLTVQTNGLWSVAQWFQNSYMPTWDNDKWCDYRTFQWVTSNRQLVGPVNDISLEHGKKGDHINHLDGTMLDMFHPGYRSYVDADMPGSGSDFRDSRIFSDLGAARNGNPAARARLINWIAAARTNLTAIFNQLPTGSGYRLDAAIYMVTNVLPSYRTIYASPSDDPTWTSALKKSDPTNATQLQRKQLVNDGHQIYQLLLKGYCDSYQIYDDQSEPALVADGAGLNLGIGETDSRDFQPRFYAWTNHIHTNHLHLFLKK